MSRRLPLGGLAAVGPALLSALLYSACGGKDLVVAREQGVEATPEAEPESPGDTVSEPAAPEVAGRPPEPVAETPGIASDATFETDRLAREVAAILQARCGSCHGGDQAEAGFADGGDFTRAIEQGVIVPGDGAQSPLLLRLSEGSTPPSVAHPGRGNTGEVALVRRFIDRLPAVPELACAPLALQSLDAIYAALLADVQRAPEQDRPFLRYVGLSYASNSGVCGPALERQRSALFKLVNSVSLAPDIRVPRSVDEAGTLYRIDVRDYAWNRAIDLQDDGQVDFADGWLALQAAAGPYAVELEGPQADALKRETTAAVPFLPAHVLVHGASAGNLYYALVGVRLSAEQTQTALGVTLSSADPDPLLQQAGFALTGQRYRESRVVRLPQRAFPGLAYWTIEDEYLDDHESIYDNPADRGYGPRRVIFHLPNGLQAYEMDSAEGLRVDVTSPDCTSESCTNGSNVLEPRNTAGCHACHEAGLVPFADELREFTENNSTRFDNDTLAEVLRTFPRPFEFARVVAADSQLHVDAISRAGVLSDGPEPISFVYEQFERGRLPLRRVAAELGVTAQALGAELDRLDPRLASLRTPDAEIDRSTMTEIYAGSLCALSSGWRNRPVGCP